MTVHWCGKPENEGGLNCPIGQNAQYTQIMLDLMDYDYKDVARQHEVDEHALYDHIIDEHGQKSADEQKQDKLVRDAEEEAYEALMNAESDSVILDKINRIMITQSINMFRNATPLEAARLTKEIRENIMAKAKLRAIEKIDSPKTQLTQINVYQKQLNDVMDVVEKALPPSMREKVFQLLPGDDPRDTLSFDVEEVMSIKPRDDLTYVERLQKESEVE